MQGMCKAIGVNGTIDLLLHVLGVVAGDGSAKCTVFLSECERGHDDEKAGVAISGDKRLVVGAFALAAASGVYCKHGHFLQS